MAYTTDNTQLANMIAQMPGLSGLKDVNSNILMLSPEVCDILGLASPDASAGIRDIDLPCAAAERAQEYRILDRHVVRKKEALTCIEINHNTRGLGGLIMERKPLINEQGIVTGIYDQGLDISQSWLFQNFLHLSYHDAKRYGQNSLARTYLLTESYNPFDLTRREDDVLFWTVRGKTAAEIAEILGRSKRTIETYHEILKKKLQVESKSQLIELAVNAGYVFHIPDRMREANFSDILDVA